ncbi:MAG: hypothetical protein IPF47_00195 [Gemmatimonadetes bacterium]|nr:hypothetical protein [Gemmatimonadota bacterium]
MSQRLEQFIFDQAALAECAREPIHIPGRIQPNGALLGLDATGAHILFAARTRRTCWGGRSVPCSTPRPRVCSGRRCARRSCARPRAPMTASRMRYLRR